MRRALLPVLLVLLLAPIAGAHIEGFSQARSLLVGPYQAYLEPQPSTIYANGSLAFTALVTDNATGNYVTNVTGTMIVRGPDGWTKTLSLVPSRGYLVTSLIPPSRGNYTADFILHDKEGRNHSAATSFIAYPDLPFRIESADPDQDVYAGASTPLALEVTRPTGGRTDAFTDLEISIEHWKDDHSEMLGQQVVTPTLAGTGLWKVDHTFPAAGMYHLRFASRSAGFNYDDVPILHLYATAPPTSSGETGQKSLPFGGVALAVAALALVVLLRRR